MLPRLPPLAWRAVGAVGRGLIGAGVLVLLFVAFQLWGTGLTHARAQDRLADEFDQRLEEVGTATTSTAAATDTTSTTGSTPTTATTAVPLTDEELAALVPGPGDPVARLRIPTIGVDEIVVHGVGVADLRNGPGHYPGSPMPGQPGNAAIAGHRTTYGQPFHDLDQLEPGDEIVVDTVQGSFTYRVMGHEADDGEVGHFIVPETGVEVLLDAGDDRLTLTACHPKFSSRQRIIVTALLVDEPAPPTPRPETTEPELDDAAADFGEGLGGESGALAPALAWGGLFLAALAAVVVAGRRWRRWPAYLLGAPVLAVTLVVAFGHLDRYLPAY